MCVLKPQPCILLFDRGVLECVCERKKGRIKISVCLFAGGLVELWLWRRCTSRKKSLQQVVNMMPHADKHRAVCVVGLTWTNGNVLPL